MRTHRHVTAVESDQNSRHCFCLSMNLGTAIELGALNCLGGVELPRGAAHLSVLITCTVVKAAKHNPASLNRCPCLGPPRLFSVAGEGADKEDLSLFKGHELHVVRANSTLIFEHSYDQKGGLKHALDGS